MMVYSYYAELTYMEYYMANAAYIGPDQFQLSTSSGAHNSENVSEMKITRRARISLTTQTMPTDDSS